VPTPFDELLDVTLDEETSGGVDTVDVGGTGSLVDRVGGVAVEHTAGGAKQTDSGTLLAANDGLTLALGDGRVKVIRNYDNFSVLDGTRLLPQQARLEWTVRASAAGDSSRNGAK